ncbi:MAG: choice-of-anchor E domain-containing protein [Isosphaeraceae bacterium]
MLIQARAFARTCLFAAVLVPGALAPSSARAAQITSSTTDTPAITQTVSLPLTPTDFSPGNSKVTGNPLTFNQFDTQNGARVLDSVTLTLHAAIQNQFAMQFTTPATITNSVGTTDPSKPGPTITMFQPDGKTSLLAVAASPSDSLSRTVTYGFKPGENLPQTFSSSLPSDSKYYIAPTNFDKTQTLKLTAPADLALFSGKGTIQLPVSAKAWSSFTTSSGNGFGSISTAGTADVTVTYNWHSGPPAPQTVPEPASLAAWGVALGLAVAAARRRAR